MHHPILRWLWLGVAALAIAGVFAIILVAARTPQLAAFTELFSVGLVIHVDLSVLVWFLCIGGVGWTALVTKHGTPWPYWLSGGFWTVMAATALIALSPLGGHWEVIKSNYIPVLNNLPFLAGLGVLAAGTWIMVLPALPFVLRRYYDRLNTEELVFAYAAPVTALAVGAFFLSGYLLEDGLPPDVRFEQLFWAGGHILQFTFSLLMMAAWVALSVALGLKPLSKLLVGIASSIAVAAAVLSAAGFYKFPFDSADFTYHHTRVMIELGGLGSGLLALVLVWRLFYFPAYTRATRAYASTLIASLVLFAAGGVLGLLITGQNVTIPAHYHGAIVGITLALMGYAYVLLPRYGYAPVAHTRLAFWQPIVYGIGQLMHIGGLAYSGGYGVLRKTPAGEMAPMAPEIQAALGFMGLGGLLAIIGGLLFVVVMLQALRRGLETRPV